MDANKAQVLRVIDYILHKTCRRCKFASIAKGSEWGTCSLYSYHHIKHNKLMQLSIGIVLLAVAICSGIWGYKKAYENSAEAITVIIADKWVETHTSTDDDGNTSTSYSYHVYTHGGRQLQCNPEGWAWDGTRKMYGRLRIDHRYEIVIAGVFSKSDIVAINRELPLGEK